MLPPRQIQCKTIFGENWDVQQRQDRNSQAFFGLDGLAHNLQDFDEKCQEIIEMEVIKQHKNFLTYVQRHLLEKLRQFVAVSGNTNLWTNNNSESINSVLKSAADWKALKLPELIKAVEERMQQRLSDLRRALFGEGNFVLIKQFQKHFTNKSAWLQMDSEKQISSQQPPF